jgi:hypothetical protein
MHDPIRDPEAYMSALEQRLSSWTPSAGGLDRDKMLFEAGRAAVSASKRAGSGPGSLPWKLATAAALLLAVGLGVAWHLERNHSRERELVDQHLVTIPHKTIAQRPVPRLADQQPSLDPASYLALVRRLTLQSLEEKPLPPGASPKLTPSGRSSPVSASRPLRVRDLDRVISL